MAFTNSLEIHELMKQRQDIIEEQSEKEMQLTKLGEDLKRVQIRDFLREVANNSRVITNLKFWNKQQDILIKRIDSDRKCNYYVLVKDNYENTINIINDGDNITKYTITFLPESSGDFEIRQQTDSCQKEYFVSLEFVYSVLKEEMDKVATSHDLELIDIYRVARIYRGIQFNYYDPLVRLAYQLKNL